jgi:hypothetical protein
MQRTTMSPLPHVIAWTLAAIGLAAFSKRLAREWRCVNVELHTNRRAAVAIKDLPTLRLDPATGEYRPQ